MSVNSFVPIKVTLYTVLIVNLLLLLCVCGRVACLQTFEACMVLVRHNY